MQYTSRSEIPRYQASGAERLARLAAFLDDVPAGMLTFTRWYGHGRGCAVGLAAHDCVWMKAQGLTLEKGPNGRISHPAYDGATDWAAVAGFFEISLERAQELFSTRGYDGAVRPHPNAVAAKVRAFIGETAVLEIA